MDMVGTGRTALVVDDEYLIASMIEDILSRRGIDVVTATRSDEATEVLKGRKVDFALIDYQMRSVPSESLWTELMRLGIPFAFCTGSVAADMAARFPGIMIVAKPFGEDEINLAADALLK